MEPLSRCTGISGPQKGPLRPWPRMKSGENTAPLCRALLCPIRAGECVGRHSATQNPPEGCYVFLSHVGA